MSSAPVRKTLTLIDEIRAGRSEPNKAAPNVCPSAAPGCEAQDLAYALSDNVPMPSDTRRGGTRASKYPWSTMSEGQSFFVAGGKINTFYTLCTSTSKRMSRLTPATPIRFVARQVVEQGVTGVRVWRKA